jgi:hypothetical protein
MKKAQVNFVGEFYKLQKKAIKHITKLVKRHRSVIFYVEPASDDEEDMLYDAPRLIYLNKHNERIDYGVVAVKLAPTPDEKIIVTAKNINDDKDIQDFTLADMLAEEVIFLAAAIESVFKR